jgi:hypothetical protein
MKFEPRRSLIVSFPRLLTLKRPNLRKITKRWRSPWRSPETHEAGFIRDIDFGEPRLHDI